MTHADLRVVMMVANDVTNDSRVRKEAAALAETGAEVTVLGVSSSGLPSREILDGALIVRVAVPFNLREERKRSRRARRDWRPPLVGYTHKSTYVARSQRIQAFGLFILGELDDQDRVLARQAHQHQKADLREDVDVHPRQHDPRDGA